MNNKEKQNGFQEKVIQAPGFCPFLFMTRGSCFVCMGHSLAKFDLSNLASKEVDGKVFTFVGNSHVRQKPMAVTLLQKAWT